MFFVIWYVLMTSVTIDVQSFSSKVGFFPSSCVEVIPGSIHDSSVRKPPTRVNIKCDVVPDGRGFLINLQSTN